MEISLLDPEFAYLFGFLQTDGCLSKSSKRKNEYFRLAVEISARDTDLIEKIQKIWPVKSSVSSRTRNTNFCKNYKSICWSSCNQEIIKKLIEFGLPPGKKSEIISPPKENFSEIDYYRGLIDGDGSLGFSSGKPFISLCTASEKVAYGFIDFVNKFCCRVNSNPNRNKRDNVFNVQFSRHVAKSIIKVLYYEKCFSLERKMIKAKSVLLWEPEKRKDLWTEEEYKLLKDNINQI